MILCSVWISVVANTEMLIVCNGLAVKGVSQWGFGQANVTSYHLWGRLLRMGHVDFTHVPTGRPSHRLRDALYGYVQATLQ